MASAASGFTRVLHCREDEGRACKVHAVQSRSLWLLSDAVRGRNLRDPGLVMMANGTMVEVGLLRFVDFMC